MSQYETHEVHIFAPVTQSNENWVDQILGTIIKPVHEVFQSSLKWMWVTRYIESVADTVRLASQEYFEQNPLPSEYLLGMDDGQVLARYIVFRVSVDETLKNQLFQTTLGLAKENGFHTLEWRTYDATTDLGSDRFIQPKADIESRKQRAELIALFVDATLKLMLDALMEENGQWKLELSEHEQNPTGSYLFSIHHLYCNLTAFHPLVHIQIQNSELDPTQKQLLINTHMMRVPLIFELTNDTEGSVWLPLMF